MLKTGSDILTLLSSTPNLEDKPVALITYYLKAPDNILYKLEDTGTSTLNSTYQQVLMPEFRELHMRNSALISALYSSDIKIADGTWDRYMGNRHGHDYTIPIPAGFGRGNNDRFRYTSIDTRERLQI